MKFSIVDIFTIASLFVCGIAWTVNRYGKHGERAAFAVVAILSPVLAVVSLIATLIDVVRGRAQISPVPLGLQEAEETVETERQRLFGGERRSPTFSISWQRAYEIQLQRKAEGVQRVADKIFAHA